VAYFGQHRLVKRLIHSGITAYRARRSPRAAGFFMRRKQATPSRLKGAPRLRRRRKKFTTKDTKNTKSHEGKSSAPSRATP
jgi:hypothetical protein